MLTPPPPDMYPGCSWADQPITTPTPPLDSIGTAATVESRTGLTTRYRVTAYDPTARTVQISPDVREDRAGVVRSFPHAQRAQSATAHVDDLDDVRLIHRRDRDDLTPWHSPQCRHVIKAAFTADGDQGVPLHRRVYRFWMESTEGRTFRFLVRAPAQERAEALARRWWQGAPTADGWTGGLLTDGELIHRLICEGARDMEVWPYPDPIAAPV
ncbi:hypothetical protein [Streptomyces sp. NPDC055140]